MYSARIPGGRQSVRPKAQASDFKRRSPRQARARNTVEAVLEAAAQILSREDRAALNTNRIADYAGISVGTLYQYFPNKQAILVELARREIENTGAAAMRAARESPSVDADPVRAVIRALIASFGKRRRVRRIAIDTLLTEGLGAELDENVRRVVQMLAAERQRLLPGRHRRVSPIRLFVLTRAVNGVLRAAAQEDSPFLKMPELEEELVRLVHTYLEDIGGRAPSQPGRARVW